MNKPGILVETGSRRFPSCERRQPTNGLAARFDELPAPFRTSEAVLAETFFLAAKHQDGPRRFFELLDSGLLVVEFNTG